jgi:hypothetical protein
MAMCALSALCRAAIDGASLRAGLPGAGLRFVILVAPDPTPYRTDARVFVFMTLHYPSADSIQTLAHGMAQMRGWMESQPGCLGVEPPLLTEDGTCLVGFSRWESKEALLATGVDLDALGETPSTELQPRQPYFLTPFSNGST